MSTSDLQLRPKADRRQNPRQPLAACPECGSASTRVVAGFTYVFHLKCDVCSEASAVQVGELR